MGQAFKWGGIALLVFYVVTQPAAAAGIVHSALGWLGDIGTGVASFVTAAVP